MSLSARDFILQKLAEYAPGIPDKETAHPLPKIDKPTTWEFGLHEHHAEKRGLHYDLRLGDPRSGHAHSWALPAKWPGPGEHIWAIQQPTHTVRYMDFEGHIPSGYGAGKVVLKDRDKIEVTKAEPGYISFNIYRGTGPEEYSLRHIGGKVWRFVNKTIHREKHQHIPEKKPDYKEVPVSKVPIDDPRYVMSAKIDDAHNIFYFPKAGEQVRVISYRKSKRAPGGFIEHTHKVDGIFGKETPKELANTVARGGLYAINPNTGRATEANIIGGMLNSNVWKSREKQKDFGKLVPVLYDIDIFRGKDLSKAPYREKLMALKQIQRAMPGVFELPDMAFTVEEKKKLLEDIKNKKHPQTEEGVVLWNAVKSEPPIKAKFRTERDVIIRGFFPGEGQHKGKGVGGFVYSMTKDGPIVGRVGTGLSHAQRRDMYKNPEKYIGLVATIGSQGEFKSKALRAPSFLRFHLDKNPQSRLDQIQLS
jgi:hypothetical protein